MNKYRLTEGEGEGEGEGEERERERGAQGIRLPRYLPSIEGRRRWAAAMTSRSDVYSGCSVCKLYTFSCACIGVRVFVFTRMVWGQFPLRGYTRFYPWSLPQAHNCVFDRDSQSLHGRCNLFHDLQNQEIDLKKGYQNPRAQIYLGETKRTLDEVKFIFACIKLFILRRFWRI